MIPVQFTGPDFVPCSDTGEDVSSCRCKKCRHGNVIVGMILAAFFSAFTSGAVAIFSSAIFHFSVMVTLFIGTVMLWVDFLVAAFCYFHETEKNP